VLTEVQATCAGMLARGRSARWCARTLHLSPHTIRAWREEPDFQAELERVRARGGKPDPYGTLLDALAARKDDGIDWPSRVRAASLLVGLEQPDDEPAAPVEW
jgi:hypothetical protein